MPQLFPFSFWKNTVGGGGGGSYFVNDDLVHVDNAAAAAVGWTSTGTPWGYTGTTLLGFPRSLQSDVFADDAYLSFTPISSYWLYVALNASLAGSNGNILELETGGGATAVVVVSVDSGTNLMSVTSGGTTNTFAWSNSTTYHLWLDVNGSTGATTVYRSTTGIRGTAITTVTGTPFAATDTVWLYGYGSGTTCLYNKLRMSATSIGDNPT